MKQSGIPHTVTGLVSASTLSALRARIGVPPVITRVAIPVSVHASVSHFHRTKIFRWSAAHAKQYYKRNSISFGSRPRVSFFFFSYFELYFAAGGHIISYASDRICFLLYAFQSTNHSTKKVLGRLYDSAQRSYEPPTLPPRRSFYNKKY